MKIYVASSWRNKHQPVIVRGLRFQGHEVYDFRHPADDNDGFRWIDIDPHAARWDNRAFRDALGTPVAERGFKYDFDALKWCDVCVLVLDCGRSAHLELGYAVGAGKKTIVLLLDFVEPELMYKMVDAICVTANEVVAKLREWDPAARPRHSSCCDDPDLVESGGSDAISIQNGN
jgi:hypothetical protein